MTKFCRAFLRLVPSLHLVCRTRSSKIQLCCSRRALWVSSNVNPVMTSHNHHCRDLFTLGLTLQVSSQVPVRCLRDMMAGWSPHTTQANIPGCGSADLPSALTDRVKELIPARPAPPCHAEGAKKVRVRACGLATTLPSPLSHTTLHSQPTATWG